jgi:hypothetical protein
MTNLNKTLIDVAFSKYKVNSCLALSRETGLHHATLRRIQNNSKYKLFSPPFKLILDNIPPDQLYPFLRELYDYYYENNI